MKLKQIADALKMSQSTVSKAINNATDVSETTRKRVLDYCLENGVSVTKKKTPQKRICVILEDIGVDNKYITYELLDGFNQAAGLYNYDVSIKTITRNEPLNYDTEMSDNNFLGSFILGINLKSPLFSQLKTTTAPAVVMDNILPNPKVASISVDSIHSVRETVSYLAETGHKKIAFLGGEKQSLISMERFGGYAGGLVSNDLAYDDRLVFFGDYTENCCLPFLDSICALKPDAVVCASDLIAIGLMKQLATRGVSVPDDLSVTGFDNIVLSQFTAPPLTTVSHDFVSIGKNAFFMLRQLIKKNIANRVTVYGNLIRRGSVIQR